MMSLSVADLSAELSSKSSDKTLLSSMKFMIAHETDLNFQNGGNVVFNTNSYKIHGLIYSNTN